MCGITASVALDAKHIPKRNSAGLSAVKHDSMTNGGVEKSNHHGQIVSQATLTEQLYASLDKILHRGPDDRKVWTSPDGHVGNERPPLLSPFTKMPLYHTAPSSITLYIVLSFDIGSSQCTELLLTYNPRSWSLPPRHQ